MIAAIIEMLTAGAKPAAIYQTLRREFGCTGARARRAICEAKGFAGDDNGR